MTYYVTWQREDMSKFVSHAIPSIRYYEAIFEIEIIKKVTGGNAKGWYQPAWASEG